MAFLESEIKLVLTQEQIVAKVWHGSSVQTTIANTICLLDLPEDAKGLVSRGTI